jgi:hypothetical protein
LNVWLLERLAEPTRSWFARALATAAASGISEDFLLPWSGSGRRLGRGSLPLSDAERATLEAAGVPFVPRGWGADELGRGLLLLAGSSATKDLCGAVEGLFRTGDFREQQAILKTLPYLAQPEQFVALASEAVRTNVVSVLEAIACDNPFPATYMPEPGLNQLVMKALFNQLPLGRVLGLPGRIGPELQRMVRAYASERRAAGRPVPSDIDLILGGGQHASV